MDSAIKDFDNHLKSHPRTILSAQYGDGKTVFLSAVEEALRNEYVFLKLYPVNYQVEENQGVFEYIKRDLLFQLYGNEMVPDSFFIPDDIVSYFFLQNNWDEFAKKILQSLSYLEGSNTLKTTIGAFKFLMAMREKYEKFKARKSSIASLLENFLATYDKKGIYEADPITSILCGIISSWKHAHPKQKICLIFEDMDRIDPAHIFRILNVVSAHMDYGYKNGPVSNKSLSGNKFGVDNIVISLDYDNLQNIYRHFYGPEACFKGYIDKFCDNGHFKYSIKKLAAQYYPTRLESVTGMSARAISAILKYVDLEPFSLRQIFNSLVDVDKQVRIRESKRGIKLHKGMVTMAAVLRRMGMSDEEIVVILSKAFTESPADIIPYIGPFMVYRRKKENYPFECTLGEKRDDSTVVYRIMKGNEIGQASILVNSVVETLVEVIEPKEEVEYLLTFVYR